MVMSGRLPPVEHLQCAEESMTSGSATLTSSSLHRQTAQEAEVCVKSQRVKLSPETKFRPTVLWLLLTPVFFL